MLYKEVLSAVAITLTFVAFYPYLRGIIQGISRCNTRGHRGEVS
jgi:hypothetical protein